MSLLFEQLVNAALIANAAIPVIKYFFMLLTFLIISVIDYNDLSANQSTFSMDCAKLYEIYEISKQTNVNFSKFNRKRLRGYLFSHKNEAVVKKTKISKNLPQINFQRDL